MNAAVEVLWEPHPGFQTNFMKQGAFEVLGGGAAGPGKTDCLIGMAARDGEHPATRGLFLRTIYTDMIEIRDRMGELFPKLGATWSAEDRRWTFPQGGRIELGYGKRMSEIERYLGREYTRLYFDELGLLPEEKPWDMLLSRLRSTSDDVPIGARASANPGGPGHAWLKRRFVDATRQGQTIYWDPDSGTSRAFVPGKADDNPSLSSAYWKRLNALPEPLRSWLRDGNWEAGLGLALTLIEKEHWVRHFEPPEHWLSFGSFDWGYAHPYCCGWFTVNEDGDMYLVDTVWGRRQTPSRIAEAIRGKFPVGRFQTIYAGQDTFHIHKAHQEKATPSIAEQMAEHEVRLIPGNTARVAGLQRMREFLMLRGDDPPRLRIMDTPGNRLVYDQLQAMVVDPDRPEDVLKVNAGDHDEPGTGGDDGYDMVKLAVASRAGPSADRVIPGLDLKDPKVLAQVAHAQNKVPPKDKRPQGINHPELGGWL